jgi:outer membrane lipoprotein-sorting protein
MKRNQEKIVSASYRVVLHHCASGTSRVGILTFMLLLLLFPAMLCAQQGDIIKDLSKISETYAETEVFSMKVCMRFIEKELVVTEQKGVVYRKENKFRTEFMGRTSLTNSHCRLLIDDDQKVLLYSDFSQATPSKAAEQGQADVMEELVQQLDELKIPSNGVKNNYRYVENSSRAKRIQITSDDPNYDFIELTINPKNNTLTKLVYQYKSTIDLPYHRIEILYQDINLGGKLNRNLFSETVYISGKADNVKPTAKYADYQVINKSTAQ